MFFFGGILEVTEDIGVFLGGGNSKYYLWCLYGDVYEDKTSRTLEVNKSG